MKALLILFLPLTMLAQNVFPPAFWAPAAKVASSAFTPTNLPGTTMGNVAWWVASDYTTNSTVSTWPSRVGTHLITNSAAATSPKGDASGLHFSGGQWLDDITINQAQPFTVFSIAAFTNVAATKILWTGASVDQRWGADALGLNGGSNSKDFIRTCLTNKFMAVAALFDAANINEWTNTVADAGPGPTQGATAWVNMTVGATAGHSFNGSFALLELVVYSGSSSATDRSNFVYYATNTYPTLVTWP